MYVRKDYFCVVDDDGLKYAGVEGILRHRLDALECLSVPTALSQADASP